MVRQCFCKFTQATRKTSCPSKFFPPFSKSRFHAEVAEAQRNRERTLKDRRRSRVRPITGDDTGRDQDTRHGFHWQRLRGTIPLVFSPARTNIERSYRAVSVPRVSNVGKCTMSGAQATRSARRVFLCMEGGSRRKHSA